MILKRNPSSYSYCLWPSNETGGANHASPSTLSGSKGKRLYHSKLYFYIILTKDGAEKSLSWISAPSSKKENKMKHITKCKCGIVMEINTDVPVKKEPVCSQCKKKKSKKETK
jgi:hypothetical protein